MAWIEKFCNTTGGGDGRDELGLSLDVASYDDLDGGHGSGNYLLYQTGAVFAGLFSGQRIYLSGVGMTTGLYEIGGVLNNDHVNLTSSAGTGNIGGVLSSSGPWTLEEADGLLASGERLNVKNDATHVLSSNISFSQGATYIDNRGVRGYNQIVGDLDTPVFNTDGSIDFANFPLINSSGNLFTLNDFNVFSSLHISGKNANSIIANTATDASTIYLCRIINTSGGSSSRCCDINDWNHFSLCEFVVEGANSFCAVDVDSQNVFHECSFINNTTGADCLRAGLGTHISQCSFRGSGEGRGIQFFSNTQAQTVRNCSFYNFKTGINFFGGSRLAGFVIKNCIAYDVNTWIGTAANANTVIIESNNALGHSSINEFCIGAHENETFVERTPTVLLFKSLGDQVNLTTNPFVGPDNGNFRLNNITGGGALCRTGAEPFGDIGALQQEFLPTTPPRARLGTS